MPLGVCLLLLWLGSVMAASGASGRIIKVLPHLLDRDGKHTLAPSLYERDAYQAFLRLHPEQCSGLRFDVQWKGRSPEPLTVRLDLRGRRGKESTTATLATARRKRGLFSRWSVLSLEGEACNHFGELTAWRATLWQGDRLLAEQKSFLWN
ncbi:MAG: hypothetical protein JXQ71_06885 [Verrucomicrobia bacterium]|nr:hypothetical protein [Verrucomicrobiota bacterium]